jgi:peptidoglycan hydrolase CwlO-like protein
MDINELAELTINLTNQYFSLKQKVDSIMATTTSEAIAKLQAIVAQAAKVNGELSSALSAKDAQIADLQQQLQNGTADVPDDVMAEINNLGAQIQQLDDLNADAPTAPSDPTVPVDPTVPTTGDITGAPGI